jgi:hypothetical protein
MKFNSLTIHWREIMSFLKNFSIRFLMLTIMTATIISGIYAQSLPQLTYPEDDAVCLQKNITFAWDTVHTAVNYNLQIFSSSTMTYPDVFFYLTSHPTSTFTYSLPESNTTYYWRVIAIYPSEIEDTSETWSFTTQGDRPVLYEPENEDICVSMTPIFEWSSIDGANSYALQVSESMTFSGDDLVYEDFSIPSSDDESITWTTLLPDHYTNYYWRVSASYTNCQSEWTEPFTFLTNQGPPDLTYPENDDVGISLNTSLSWTEVTPSCIYDVELATDSDFSDIIQSFDNLTTTSTTLSPLNYDTQYFWRVKSKLDIGEEVFCISDWSDVSNFKTVFSAPELNAPYNGRICLDLEYRYSWFEVPGVQGYQLQIAKDSMFIDIVVDEEDIFDLYYDAKVSEGLTTYYWRVRAKDSYNTGMWSNIRTFVSTISPPEPVYPANNSGGVAKEFVLEWSDVTKGGGEYHLQLSESPDFADTLFNFVELTSNTYSISLPESNKAYYWRVAATYEECSIDFSEIWKFTTIIGSPVLLSPPDNANNQPFTVFFEWNPVVDADKYTIHIADNPDFSPITYGMSGITNTHYLQPGLQPNTTYYWKVQAENEFGAGEFSEVFSLTTSPRGAAVPLLISPTFGAEQVETDVTLVWSESERADFYHLQVDTKEDFSSPMVDLDTLTSTSYELTGLLNNQKYYWHVSAINDSGETKFSELGNFTTKILAPSEAPILLRPGNDSTNLDRTVVFKWSNVIHADYYEIQISLSDDFDGDLFFSDEYVYLPEKTVADHEYNTTYYWRVRAKNISGIGQWSEVFNYTIRDGMGINDDLITKFTINSYPNPFNDNILLSFILPEIENVKVSVINSAGYEITKLIDKTLSAGEHKINWHPENIADGTYYYSISIGDVKLIKVIKYIK